MTAPSPKRERPRRLWHYAGLLAISLIAANGLIGEKGLVESWRARSEHAKLSRALARVRAENQQLIDEVQRQNDPKVIEELARRHLGLIKPGEVVVVVKDAPTSSPDETPDGTGKAAPPAR
ncbi:MAG: septum formation initiator family protein [Vicinamibacterales bacterium]